MTFKNYYSQKNRYGNCQFLTAREIEDAPADVKADLMEHLRKNDGTIGIYVYHSHELNVETGKIEFKGMKMGYYIRSWQWMRHAPIRNWFWKHRAVNGN